MSLSCYNAFRYGYISPGQRIFGSPNVHSTFRSLSREVFSRRGSTVGPGSITLKPKISCYAYRSQNLDEALLSENNFVQHSVSHATSKRS